MRRSANKGFSLIELMVTLSVVAILFAFALPNLRNFIRNSRLSSGINDMLHSFNLARTEAVKRQAGNVVVCGSSAPMAASPACTYDSFRGWFVFVDTNQNWQHDAGEPVLEQHDLLDTSVTVAVDANNNIVSYSPTGFANPAAAKIPTGYMVLCDSRGVTALGTNSTARAMVISTTGRARSSALQADIVNVVLPKVVGGHCP
jgi:type IV fimbrial biogenesis protein FimT